MEHGNEAPRCLVVDDDKGMRMLTRLQLEMAGAEVVVASALTDATARIAQADVPFAMVVCDRRLANDERGVEVLEAARDRSADTILVLLTAHIDENAEAEAMALGADLVDKIDTSPLLARLSTIFRSTDS